MYHHIVFDKTLIPADSLPASCDTFNGISFEILVPNGSHVRIGDDLIHFRFYQKYSNAIIGEYVLPSDSDGYICGIWGEFGKRYRGSFHGIILMTICPSSDSTIQYKFPTCYKIVQDEFSGNHLIQWERTGGLKIASYALNSFNLKLTTVENSPVMVFYYPKKDCNIRRKDFLAFKFEDEEIVRFPIQNQPLLFDRVRSISSVTIPLSGKDILRFAAKGWYAIRVEHDNGDIPFLVPNKYRDHYDVPESLEVFKRYAQEYVKALGEMGIELSEPVKEEPESVQVSDESCYVYLMVDTTNGYHKIGISNHPEYRERTLQSEKPTIEKVCAKQFPSRQIALAIESALHSTFSLKRIRGEWFNLTAEEVAQVIETLK